MLIVSLTSSCMPPSFPYNFSVRLSELISQAAMPASVTENFFRVQEISVYSISFTDYKHRHALVENMNLPDVVVDFLL